MRGWVQAGIQAKIDKIKEDIAKWQTEAAAGREKLTALVPALPELRFLAQVSAPPARFSHRFSLC